MTDNTKILLAHGGGGKLSRELIEQEILSRLSPESTTEMPDAASLILPGKRIVFTTDSFVVSPAFFPGGNIGDLAIHGTVNDISVSGATPLALSLAFIIEEGFSMDDFRTILESIRKAAQRCGTSIVTGDTKVVEAGHCDGIFINTAGIGIRIKGFRLHQSHIKPGDLVLISGTIAEHGMAVLCSRNNIEMSNGPESDSAPVHQLVQSIAHLAPHIRFMRDPTRGGLSAVLNEIVEKQAFGISIIENELPVSDKCRVVSELLGTDLLHVASEGRLVAVCEKKYAQEIIRIWKSLPEGKGAACIGAVTKKAGKVILETTNGGKRFVDMPRGELLPRIC